MLSAKTETPFPYSETETGRSDLKTKQRIYFPLFCFIIYEK